MVNSLCFVKLLSRHQHFLSLLLRHYYIHWRFIQFVALKLIAMSTAKKSKPGARHFQESWTADVGFVCRNGRAVCTLVQDDSEKNEGLKRQFLVTKTE